MSFLPPINLFLHFLVNVIHFFAFKSLNVAFILLFRIYVFVCFFKCLIFVIFSVSLFPQLLVFMSFFYNGIPLMAVHFSKIFIGIAINLIDWIFFDKFKIVFENVVQFIKVRPKFLFIFEHQLNNLRQFLVLGFVENV